MLLLLLLLMLMMMISYPPLQAGTKKKSNYTFNIINPIFSSLQLLDNSLFQNGHRHEKTCLWGFANNKGADQPVYLCSLISALIIHLLESIISGLATSEIPIF